MPTLDGNTIFLLSQYDAQVLPEYAPSRSPDPFREADNVRLYDAQTRTISVYVPVYRNSQFWIAYQCTPPDDEPQMKYYYFRLTINGRDVVSWGCGKADDWSGRTMFGLFQGHRMQKGSIEPCTEVRAFYWGLAEDEKVEQKENVIEIRMYRARARKRTEPDLRALTETPAAPLSMHNNKQDKLNRDKAATVGLFNAGPLMYGQPQRFYKYALFDPVDQPHVTFRYLYRSLPMLKQLGVIALDDLEKQTAESVAASPYGGELQKRSGPRMVPSISLRSIVSIRSDTGMQFDPDQPPPGVPSPSPLRIPTMALKKPGFSLANISKDDLSVQTRDSLDSDDAEVEPSKRPQSPRRKLYMNENSPIHSAVAVEKSPKVRSRTPRMSKIPVLRPRSSKEQMFRTCVSYLLDQPPPRPTTPAPGDTSPSPAPRRNRLFNRSSSETLHSDQSDSAEPQRRVSSTSTKSTATPHSHLGHTWMNDIFDKAKSRQDERAKKDKQDEPVNKEMQKNKSEPQTRLRVPSASRLAHQQSMNALQGLVDSAQGRRIKEQRKPKAP